MWRQRCVVGSTEPVRLDPDIIAEVSGTRDQRPRTRDMDPVQPLLDRFRPRSEAVSVSLSVLRCLSASEDRAGSSWALVLACDVTSVPPESYLRVHSGAVVCLMTRRAVGHY